MRSVITENQSVFWGVRGFMIQVNKRSSHFRQHFKLHLQRLPCTCVGKHACHQRNLKQPSTSKASTTATTPSFHSCAAPAGPLTNIMSFSQGHVCRQHYVYLSYKRAPKGVRPASTMHGFSQGEPPAVPSNPACKQACLCTLRALRALTSWRRSQRHRLPDVG